MKIRLTGLVLLGLAASASAQGFAGGDRNQRAVDANAATACFACHQAQKDRDYVFSALGPGEATRK